MEEFYNIFGPELKAVTGDPKRIDDVLCRVDGLVTPMESLTFDPFSIKSSQYWKYVMDDFKIEVLASSFSLSNLPGYLVLLRGFLFVYFKSQRLIAAFFVKNGSNTEEHKVKVNIP